MSAARKATINWSDIVDGNGTDPGLYSIAREIQHSLHYLLNDLEFKFDLSRAREVSPNGIDLSFQKDGIDATMWLTSEAWSKAKDLVEKIEAVQQRIDEASK